VRKGGAQQATPLSSDRCRHVIVHAPGVGVEDCSEILVAMFESIEKVFEGNVDVHFFEGQYAFHGVGRARLTSADEFLAGDEQP
jgi:hypothetical protein